MSEQMAYNREQQQQQQQQTQILDDDTYQRAMRRWVQLDVFLAKQNQAVKEVRNERARLSPHILRYMENHNLCGSEISSENAGTIAYGTETTYTSFTQKFVSDTLLEFFENDTAKHAECMAFLKSKRTPTVQAVLKRTMPK